MTTIKVDANVNWQVKQATGGNWVAVCAPLKLTVQGETWAELMEDIGLTLGALMKDLLESNELNQFLHEQGWSLLTPLPNQPDDVQFDVPFLPALIRNGSARHLHQ